MSLFNKTLLHNKPANFNSRHISVVMIWLKILNELEHIKKNDKGKKNAREHMWKNFSIDKPSEMLTSVTREGSRKRTHGLSM